LAEQAKILVAEAVENNLDLQPSWNRWHTCGQCEQQYHGVVKCALGWACWKTYVGRPEMDVPRQCAMTDLGNGLSAAEHYEDALSAYEARLSTLKRLGASETHILAAQSNLAFTYTNLGRHEEALLMRRDVYSGRLKLNGEEHGKTVLAAYNYAASLVSLGRFEQAKSLLRKTMPVARRTLGEGHILTHKLRCSYAAALYKDDSATPDDLREAVNALEDVERIERRALGGAHPVTRLIEQRLRAARAALRAREETAARDVSSLREAVAAMTPGDA